MEEMERENNSLKNCIEELKEQMKVIRDMYTKDDFEDRNKMKKMEEEIKELREEKEKMKKEIEELRSEKEREDWRNKNIQRRERKEMHKDVIDMEMTKGKLHSPSPVPGPSGAIGKRGKAIGPAEEYEEEKEKEISMGRWDYVGRRETEK